MIQGRHLSFSYSAGATLTFPDIDVAQGAVVLLSGPSGCGKSTWLALVAALVPANSGELVVAGQSLPGLSRVAADAWRTSRTASLDDEAAAAVGRLLETARARGATLVIATHDQRVAPKSPATPAGQAGFTAMKLSRQPHGAGA